MNNSNAGFLAFLGVAVAAVIGAFFVSPQFFKVGSEAVSQSEPAANLVDATAPQPQAAAPETAAVAPEATVDKSEAEVGTSDAAGTEVASAEPSQPASSDAWVIPSFDVLRVEPDGSTVIAGKAEPGTKLNIMNGDTVIASTSVGPSGDFAAILDTPLPAGDYQLTLQIVGEGGETRRSEEIATISIPKDASGELLAMVTKPGKASRIIAQPAAPESEPVEMASTEPATQAGQTEIQAEPTTQSPAAATDTAGGQPSAVETPALPDASADLTQAAPALATSDQPAETMTPDAPADTATAPEVAMASPQPASDASETALPAGATVRVDAVEIEGSRIFVAGSATPGYPVQVSADGVVIGMEKADETGRFIIEATSDLTVGNHIISADLMDSTGKEVLLRATVPFNRPEGQALAAVAPSEGNASGADAASGGLTLPDIESLSKMREASFEALSKLEKILSAGETPNSEVVSAAYMDAITRLKAAATADLPAGSSAEAMQMARSMRSQAEAALAALNPPATAGSTPAPDGAMTADLGNMREKLKQAETA